MTPVPVSVDQLAKSIVAAGVMPAEELKTLWSALPAGGRPKDGEALAALLVKDGKLTEFQSQELLSGTGAMLVLGDYLLLSKLGAGGMGQVFKAQHRHMDRLVAIKLLPAAMTKDEANVKRFQREVKAAAKLTHPNIVQAYDASVQRGVWYLVMEYVEGCDLSALVRDRGPLPVQEAVDCILQAARGLAYAHGEGVIHRDIKPANLLLDKKGTVKILDMGLARFDNSGDAADHQLTNTGQVMGTVDYMAPEQATNTHNADHRSDIYALGCSLYRLLVGESMFGGQTAVEKILAHMNEAIPSLCQKRRDVPAEIDRIFQKMVAKKPTDRYQKTTDLVADLEAYLNLGATTAFTRPMMPEQDSKLTDIFRTVGTQQALKTPTKTAPEKEQTVAWLAPEIETDPKSESIVPGVHGLAAKPQPKGKSGRSKPPAKLIAGGIGGLALLLFGIWVIVKDKDGNEVGRMKVPDGGNVVMQSDSTTSKKPATTPTPKPMPVGPQPPPAVAPFDAQTARSHQDAWAKHLGIQVATPNSVGQMMILIPPGEFLMGSTDEQVEAALKAAEEVKADQPTKDCIEKAERPQHKVAITKPLLMSATEVTIGQFKKFAAATGYQTEAEKAEAAAKAASPVAGRPPAKPIQTYLNPGYVVDDDSPAAVITWNDATAYCQWLSTQEKTTYRLPTEAEWEYACRAGTTTQYSFGDDYNELPKYGWNNQNAGGKSHPVGTLLPNPFGLFDMHGDLNEWCGDYYDDTWYEKTSPNDANGPSVGSDRVIRGGTWLFNASACRSASRNPESPSYRYNANGFRCVSELDVPAVPATSSTKPTTPPAVEPTPKPMPVGPQPPPAVAPFNAKTARSHQDAWAKHLGIQVETPNSVGQTMILIPPGEFLMGSTDEQVEAALNVAEEAEANRGIKGRIENAERPQHKVAITKPFLMSSTEVTVGQFKKFTAAAGYQTEAEKAEAGQSPPKPIQTYLHPGYVASDDLPAAFITWNDAVAYCKWLSEQEKRTYRLPTEAEWEYACRAGTTTQYSFGDDYNELSKYGWHKGNAGGKSHPVGTLLPNPFGLFDMHGNLFEWCGDNYDEKWYSTSPPNDPDGPSVGSLRVIRGGIWNNNASQCRSASRNNNMPSNRSVNLGFRCVSGW